jgi:hypothetical protein
MAEENVAPRSNRRLVRANSPEKTPQSALESETPRIRAVNANFLAVRGVVCELVAEIPV